jgi:hypothetical protein
MPSNQTSRRDFLKVAAAGAVGLGAGEASGASRPPRATSCIFINLIGGPSHIDTFDPKPHATSEVRGPFRPIQTRSPAFS